MKDLVQRVHVDPQIREQEFGNFQDPGLTQKAQQGAQSRHVLGAGLVILLGDVLHIYPWKKLEKLLFLQSRGGADRKEEGSIFHIAAS